MDISYLGHASFKIKTKTATIITDPFDSKMVGLKFPTADSDIVTISHDHPDHASTSKITGYKKVLDGPGEYEVSGVSVMGYPTFHDNKKGQERGKNTIYVIEADGLRIAHLGDVGHVLSDELIDEVGDIDMLMIPVGGYYTIGPKEAVEIISKIEPYFIFPMHYNLEGMNTELSQNLLQVSDFIKESGLTTENLPKLSIKKEDISEEQTTKIIVLEAKQ